MFPTSLKGASSTFSGVFLPFPSLSAEQKISLMQEQCVSGKEIPLVSSSPLRGQSLAAWSSLSQLSFFDAASHVSEED
jgi:hypothetical protein